ncbi:unnamed protein product [Pleuronectes platessa]|uniref:Uncharacterized protein n=1 Tax=Pleuronectes platessa TaxID=8262 RepID=A0A9N7UXW1_PLEPL|nr:unnamed protein product [Pleuronectes platessa]
MKEAPTESEPTGWQEEIEDTGVGLSVPICHRHQPAGSSASDRLGTLSLPLFITGREERDLKEQVWVGRREEGADSEVPYIRVLTILVMEGPQLQMCGCNSLQDSL